MKDIASTYRMTVDILENADGFQLECYGVAALGSDGACETVRCITPHAEEIDALISLLARNEVTPLALREVVDDWLLRE